MKECDNRISLIEADAITVSVSHQHSSDLTINGRRVVLKSLHHPHQYPGAAKLSIKSAESKASKYLETRYDAYYEWMESRLNHTLSPDLRDVVREVYMDLYPLPTDSDVYALNIMINDAENDYTYGWIVAEYDRARGYHVRILFAQAEGKDMEEVMYDSGQPIIHHLVHILTCMHSYLPLEISLMKGLHGGIESLFKSLGFIANRILLAYDPSAWNNIYRYTCDHLSRKFYGYDPNKDTWHLVPKNRKSTIRDIYGSVMYPSTQRTIEKYRDKIQYYESDSKYRDPHKRIFTKYTIFMPRKKAIYGWATYYTIARHIVHNIVNIAGNHEGILMDRYICVECNVGTPGKGIASDYHTENTLSIVLRRDVSDNQPNVRSNKATSIMNLGTINPIKPMVPWIPVRKPNYFKRKKS